MLNKFAERWFTRSSHSLETLFHDGAPDYEHCPETLDFHFTPVGQMLTSYPKEFKTRLEIYRHLAEKNLLRNDDYIAVTTEHLKDIEQLAMASFRKGKIGKLVWAWGLGEIRTVGRVAQRNNINDGNLITIHNHRGQFSPQEIKAFLRYAEKLIPGINGSPRDLQKALRLLRGNRLLDLVDEEGGTAVLADDGDGFSN